MKKSNYIKRNSFIDRACHWLVVICFFFVALSGLGLFFPSLQSFTFLLGTPQLGRILHPFLGIVIMGLLVIMFFRFVKHNIPQKGDLTWWKHIIQVLQGDEHKVFKTDQYNPGQKVMFWTIMGSMSILTLSGIVIWRPYFAGYFPIWAIRMALLIHAFMAILLIFAIIMHMYLAFWIKGSITGMIEGKVTRRWAAKHHPRWLQRIEQKEDLQQTLSSQENKGNVSP